MARLHVDACEAMDNLVQGKKAPATGFNQHVPPNWKTALSSGSSNIPLMLATASYCYNFIRRPLMAEYVTTCRGRFQLAEPLSWIYSTWTTTCWAVMVWWETRGKGDDAIRTHDFAPLIRQVLALGKLMTAKIGSRNIVCLAGCRSWGENPGDDGYLHDHFAILRGEKRPKKYNKAVSWANTALTNAAILHVFKVLWEDLPSSPADLWALVQFPMRAPFQFIGYADGSRICIMGADDGDEFVDEDLNGNTPGVLLYGSSHGRKVMAPACPAPNGGFDRIRQTNVKGDVDYMPGLRGWLLRHSHVGVVKKGEYWETFTPEPTAEKTFHYQIDPDGAKTDHMPSQVPAPPPGPTPPPTPAPPKKEGSKWTSWL